jgi:hypothetical protein
LQSPSLTVFFDELKAFPSVYVFAVSGQEATIRSSLTHFVTELGLTEYLHSSESPGEGVKVSLGPFVRVSTGEEITLMRTENRAAGVANE